MGFARSMRPEGQPSLRVANEELARMVARLGVTVQALSGEVQALTERVGVLESEVIAAKRRQLRRAKREAERRAASSKALWDARAARFEKAEAAETIALIVSKVSVEFGVEVTVILGRSRAREAAFARQEVFMRAREAGHSFPKIAQAMGRDPATVQHGVKSVAMRRAITARRKAMDHV